MAVTCERWRLISECTVCFLLWLCTLHITLSLHILPQYLPKHIWKACQVFKVTPSVLTTPVSQSVRVDVSDNWAALVAAAALSW